MAVSEGGGDLSTLDRRGGWPRPEVGYNHGPEALWTREFPVRFGVGVNRRAIPNGYLRRQGDRLPVTELGQRRDRFLPAFP